MHFVAHTFVLLAQDGKHGNVVVVVAVASVVVDAVIETAQSEQPIQEAYVHLVDHGLVLV